MRKLIRKVIEPIVREIVKGSKELNITVNIDKVIEKVEYKKPLDENFDKELYTWLEKITSKDSPIPQSDEIRKKY
ncbi:hypothetical protein [Dysgonomonas sp. 520]|uniref:hypothetical protein n=1 Tax=Dysgonomonas sp. 520 TaxID=2302931 RepID=UPI0013D496B4|nr:hypothetical protein [Dysgonomonas sp. 520]NDW10926.1 hypothetical protein [Dysgonomonas sp. 520]